MRRRSLVGCALACALVFVAAASAAAPSNFAGTWVLDKTRSKDLPLSWQNYLDSYTMIVAQDEKQLTIENKHELKPLPLRPDGGGGGGGTGQGRERGIGAGLPSIPESLTYKLDGSETTGEGGRRLGPPTLKAEWKDDGKALELSETRKFTTNDGEERSLKTTERWELSADGKTLTVNRSSDSPRGTMKSTLVFNKQ